MPCFDVQDEVNTLWESAKLKRPCCFSVVAILIAPSIAPYIASGFDASNHRSPIGSGTAMLNHTALQQRAFFNSLTFHRQPEIELQPKRLPVAVVG